MHTYIHTYAFILSYACHACHTPLFCTTPILGKNVIEYLNHKLWEFHRPISCVLRACPFIYCFIFTKTALFIIEPFLERRKRASCQQTTLH